VNYKHLRAKIILTLLATSILLIIVTESYHYHMRKDVLYNVSIEKLLILSKTMRNFEKVQLQLYKSRFKKIERNQNILKAIQNSDISMLRVELDRLSLYFKESSPSLKHIHLYDKNGNLFYSADKQDKYLYTNIVNNAVLVESIRTDKFTKGYVLTKNKGFYTSFITPIKLDSKTIGYFEFGIQADSLFKIASKAGRYKYALYLQNKSIEGQRELGKLVSSNSKIFKQLNISQDFIYENANKNIVISHGDKYYLLTQYDIESSFQKNFAQVIMASNVTNYVNDNFYKAMYMVGVSLIVLFALIIIVYIIFTKLINKLSREEEELRTKQTQIQIIMDNSESLISLLEDENLVLVNKPFLKFLSCSDMGIFISQHNNLSTLFIPSEDTFSAKNALNNSTWIKQINSLEKDNQVVTLKHPYFGLNYFSVTITNIPEHPKSKIIIFTNITSIFKKSKKDEYLAYHDNLTKIFNRQYFNEIVSQNIFNARYDKKKATLLMFDLDFFKRINDTFGHQVGDDVLIKFTEVISNNIRTNDLFVRWGGEEFLLLLNDATRDTSTTVSDYLRTKIENTDFKEAGKITCSIGASEYREGDNIDSWIERVDKALYQAKTNGRNRVEFI